MSPRQPQMSISMPPGFGSFYTEGEMPHTPKNDEEILTPCEPPPPPRQTYKVKRKRVTALPVGTNLLDMESTIIPTIEMSEAMDSSPELPSPLLAPMHTTTGLLAPINQLMRSVTPPKTPAARILTSFDTMESAAKEWGLITDSRQKPNFERTGSVGSSFSDSSLSSLGSSAFSLISPASEANDPFADDAGSLRGKALAPDPTSPSAKRAKTQRRTAWNPAMDDHLWMTYMAYLSDPTLTPFKMLPGTAPPLGVCHRVASKAKRTWREHRTVSSCTSLDDVFAGRNQREGSPDTIRGESSDMAREKAAQWPRSESDTRKRLRALCKRRPSLSAHYQRLLRTRSPSPFQSSASTARSSDLPSAFQSSELKMSLITSTNASMQPDGPLAQLTSEDLPPRPQSQHTTRPTDWFARIGRSQAHQKSMSLQSITGVDTAPVRNTSSLASPFDELTNRSHLLQSMSTTKSLGRDFNRGVPFLDSPFEVQGAPTAPRSLKRRFRSDEEKPRRLPLQGVFASDDSSSSGPRSRAFSLGGSSASDNFASLFNPPDLRPAVALHAPTPLSMHGDHDMLETPDLSMLGPPGSRSAPRRLAEPTPRLGSPFVESTPLSRQFHTFPRSILPSGEHPQPFQQRLQQLASEHAAHQHQSMQQ